MPNEKDLKFGLWFRCTNWIENFIARFTNTGTNILKIVQRFKIYKVSIRKVNRTIKRLKTLFL